MWLVTVVYQWRPWPWNGHLWEVQRITFILASFKVTSSLGFTCFPCFVTMPFGLSWIMNISVVGTTLFLAAWFIVCLWRIKMGPMQCFFACSVFHMYTSNLPIRMGFSSLIADPSSINCMVLKSRSKVLGCHSHSTRHWTQLIQSPWRLLHSFILIMVACRTYNKSRCHSYPYTNQYWIVPIHLYLQQICT
jgi:hypothetical protein